MDSHLRSDQIYVYRSTLICTDKWWKFVVEKQDVNICSDLSVIYETKSLRYFLIFCLKNPSLEYVLPHFMIYTDYQAKPNVSSDLFINPVLNPCLNQYSHLITCQTRNWIYNSLPQIKALYIYVFLPEGANPFSHMKYLTRNKHLIHFNFFDRKVTASTLGTP